MPRAHKPNCHLLIRKPKPELSISDHARALHAAHPALTTSEIARALTVERGRPVSIQAVQSALRYESGQRGRKVDWAARVERLRRELVEAERELASEP